MGREGGGRNGGNTSLELEDVLELVREEDFLHAREGLLVCEMETRLDGVVETDLPIVAGQHYTAGADEGGGGGVVAVGEGGLKECGWEREVVGK